MKKILVILSIILALKANAGVVYGGGYVLPQPYGPTCNSQYYVEVGFYAEVEVNMSTYQMEKSKDPNFSTYSYVGTYQNGSFSASGNQYSWVDYGPFAPGDVWYYRVEGNSNFNVTSYYNLPGPFSNNVPSIVNWVNQVTSHFTVGSTPSTESSYTWGQESRDMQGVNISLIPTELVKIYLELNNNTINFLIDPTSSFIGLDVNVDGQGFNSIYTGSSVTNFEWHGSAASFPSIGQHDLQVRFTTPDGNITYREYTAFVVPRSDAFYQDNYCNTMRVWKGNDPTNGTPVILSAGFDTYNQKGEQYYRQAGNDLINCLLNKGFNVYVVYYNLNSQSMVNNSAVFQSAIRFVSSINSNKKVVATGMSMGGVINRFACAKAENDGVPLPISHFVTLDAPHQGAVVSKSLQDWRKIQVAGDAYSEFASDNDAAKELLTYNAYDPSGGVHTNFYSQLNALNGDGYPHLVPKIGVSFSTNNPNPNPVGAEWLYVNVTVSPSHDQHFYLATDEAAAGSFLPKINTDPIPLLESGKWGFQVLLSFIHPFAYEAAILSEYLDPSFIPHISSLDITGGVSKFNGTNDKIIIPSTTSFHDKVPSDIIEPLVNALLTDNIYVQDRTFSANYDMVAQQGIFAGNAVTTTLPNGDVYVNNHAQVTFKAGQQVVLSSGFNVQNAEFTAVIDIAHCDGVNENQHRMANNGNNNLTASNNPQPVVSNATNNTTSIAPTKLGDNIKLGIFPNPTSGVVYLNLSAQNAGSLLVNLSDVSGKQIMHNSFGVNEGANSYKLDLSSLNSGVYYINVTDENGVSIKNDKLILMGQ